MGRPLTRAPQKIIQLIACAFFLPSISRTCRRASPTHRRYTKLPAAAPRPCQRTRPFLNLVTPPDIPRLSGSFPPCRPPHRYVRNGRAGILRIAAAPYIDGVAGDAVDHHLPHRHGLRRPDDNAGAFRAVNIDVFDTHILAVSQLNCPLRGRAASTGVPDFHVSYLVAEYSGAP